MVQQQGWERDFTVSKRAVHQTSATRLSSSTGVSTAHRPPTLVQCRGASSCWRWGPRGVRRGTAGGRGPLLAWIDSEDFQNQYWIGKIYILQCTDESICLAKRCCLHLFLSPCLVCWWHAAVRLCGGLVLPDWVFFIYLFIFFPLHIKACLRCVLADWKARWKSGTLLNQVKLCGSAVHQCQNESIHNNVHEAEILNVQVHIRPKYERVHERSFTECVQTQHWHISIVCRITLVTLVLATRLNIYL